MDKKKKTAKDLELEKQKNIEKLEILQKAKETQGKQLSIDIEDGQLKEIDELKELIDKKFDNPEEKHSLFYNGIQNLLLKYLPRYTALATSYFEISKRAQCFSIIKSASLKRYERSKSDICVNSTFLSDTPTDAVGSIPINN